MKREINENIIYEIKTLFFNIENVISEKYKEFKKYTFIYDFNNNKYNYIYYNLMMIIYLKNNKLSNNSII